MAARQVRALLMGDQACVFYGAAEFSRDTDLLILADAENLRRLSTALQELRAECIAVPPFAVEFRIIQRVRLLSPLPGGEGQGEGERHTKQRRK